MRQYQARLPHGHYQQESAANASSDADPRKYSTRAPVCNTASTKLLEHVNENDYANVREQGAHDVPV